MPCCLSVTNSARLDVRLMQEKIMQSLWNTGDLMFSLLATLKQTHFVYRNSRTSIGIRKPVWL